MHNNDGITSLKAAIPSAARTRATAEAAHLEQETTTQVTKAPKSGAPRAAAQSSCTGAAKSAVSCQQRNKWKSAAPNQLSPLSATATAAPQIQQQDPEWRLSGQKSLQLAAAAVDKRKESDKEMARCRCGSETGHCIGRWPVISSGGCSVGHHSAGYLSSSSLLMAIGSKRRRGNNYTSEVSEQQRQRRRKRIDDDDDERPITRKIIDNNNNNNNHVLVNKCVSGDKENMKTTTPTKNKLELDDELRATKDCDCRIAKASTSSLSSPLSIQPEAFSSVESNYCAKVKNRSANERVVAVVQENCRCGKDLRPTELEMKGYLEDRSRQLEIKKNKRRSGRRTGIVESSSSPPSSNRCLPQAHHARREAGEPKRKPAKQRHPCGRAKSAHLSAAPATKQLVSRNFNTMILIQLTQLVFIYVLITSSIVAPVSSTNYWPLRSKLQHQQQQQQQHHHLHSHQQQQQQQQQQNQHHHLHQQQQITSPANLLADNQPPPRSSSSHQLLIGQHYNNFSSIVPYSIVQDSDYGSSAEDPLMEEQQQVLSQLPQPPLLPPLQQPVALGSPTELSVAGGEGTGERDEVSSLKSRALLPLDSNRLILPQMQQIKSRFNQGCVGGTKCQFFAFCWMSGGSLGASCGLLMTCCVTPSRQEIQPGFYGPVVNDPYCGRSTSKINRIVGGTDASFGQFPWQAFVQVGGSRCGGALISSRHVVTAGHCVARSQHSPSSIKVTLGDYILNSDIESIPHEVFSVVEVLLHPNFRFTPQADRYDVAVLELDRTASYKDNIKPICLPQKDAAFVGRVAYVAGWGALQAGSKLRPKVLQHVAVPVIENQVCESWHRRKGIDIRIYDEMMCAGYELGQRDACQGDSGGPLMLNQFGVWYLVGIVSAGYSCAKQYQPGIYHRVSSSSDWISSNVYQQGSNK